MHLLKRSKARKLALTLVLGFLIVAMGVLCAKITVNASEPRAAGPEHSMELIFMSRAGEWHVTQEGVVRLHRKGRQALATQIADGILDAILSSETSMEVLSPQGLYVVEVDGERITSREHFKAASFLSYNQIIGSCDGIWVKGKESVDCIQSGKVTAKVGISELTSGLDLPESSLRRQFLPLLEADSVAGTLYMVLRHSNGGMRYVVFNPVTKKWDISINLTDTVVAPLIRKEDGLLLLDGSGRVFHVPRGTLRDVPNRSTRNLYSQVSGTEYVTATLRAQMGKGESFHLIVDSARGTEKKRVKCPTRDRVYCDSTGCYSWLPSWSSGIQILPFSAKDR
jgi:hypothetical protein